MNLEDVCVMVTLKTHLGEGRPQEPTNPHFSKILIKT
jgi:hypothetical protein